MTVTLDATVGGASANSYIDVATADALIPLLVSKARTTAWASVSAGDKDVHLIRSVKMLESYVDFYGQRLVQDQPLAWPRDFVFGPDRLFPYLVTEIPPPVQEAQALMALNLSEGFDQDAAAGSPLKEMKISTLDLKFNENRSARGATLVPAEVVEKLRGFGDYVGSSGMARSISMSRA